MSNIFTKEELNYLKEYYPCTSTKKIAKFLGRSEYGIRVMASKLKLRKLAKYIKPNNEIQVDIVKSYVIDKLAVATIAKSFNIPWSMVLKVLKANKIHIRNASEAIKKHSLDERVFSAIDSEEKAYWLGFIYADGNVRKNILQIGLANKDEKHLANFNKFMKADHPIYKNGKNACKVFYTSNVLVNDLKTAGVHPRKSLTLVFPNIHQVPHYLIRHFIRGYFDGDGSVWLSWVSKRRCFQWGVSFVGTEEFLKEISNNIIKLGFNNNKLYQPYLGKNIYTLGWGGIKGDRLSQLYQYLYEDSSIFLERKKDKFIQIMNYYNIPRCEK